MGMEKPKTPEEIAKIEKSRTISDAEFLKDGATYIIDQESGGKRLTNISINRTYLPRRESSGTEKDWNTRAEIIRKIMAYNLQFEASERSGKDKTVETYFRPTLFVHTRDGGMCSVIRTREDDSVKIDYEKGELDVPYFDHKAATVKRRKIQFAEIDQVILGGEQTRRGRMGDSAGNTVVEGLV